MEVVVGNLPCLKTLNIRSFKKLKVLPDQLSRLGALQELHIEDCNELESLSEDVLQGLTSLQYLKISYCSKLKSLSEGVGHLACLEHFEARGCPELVDLPNNMNKLTALREVSMAHSRLLPEGLQHIPSLQTLHIETCDCTSLPVWLGDMTSLRQLSIHRCRELRSLPSNIQRLTNLRELTIRALTFTSLPDWLGDMTPLRQLQLEKRCNKETDEDLQYITHIPLVLLDPPVLLDDPFAETFGDKTRLTLKKFATLFAKNALPHDSDDINYGDEFDRKKFAILFAINALPHSIKPEDEFDRMVDDNVQAPFGLKMGLTWRPSKIMSIAI